MVKYWKEFLLRDAENKNEIRKYVIIVRICALLTSIYQLGLTIWALFLGYPQAAAFFLAEVVAFAAIVRITFRGHAELLGTVYQTMLLIHMVGVSVFFGEETKIMAFIYLEIALLYTRSYLSGKVKAAIVGGMLLLRYAIFIQDQRYGPMYPLGDGMNTVLTLLNMTVVTILLAIAIFYASQDFHSMEQSIITYNRDLENQVTHDCLTGLYSRSKINNILRESIQFYRECSMNSLSVAMGDIDFFKRINDVYGHDCGDKILRELSGIMQRFMDKRGAVGRWGGEEFLFVFQNHNGDEAYVALSELMGDIQKHTFKYGGVQVGVTMTFGVAECGRKISQEEMVKDADENLYRGKENGRNRIEF